jgi:NAD(P)-dependent dehydrogenase (short-subunit alcohol dehydrogenase family)
MSDQPNLQSSTNVSDPDPSSIVPQLGAFGITYGDLETSIKVLHAVAALNPKRKKNGSILDPSMREDGSVQVDRNQDSSDGIAQYKEPNLRPFRKALASCLDLHQRTMFQGVPEEDHYDHRRQERSLKRQKMAEKDLYKKHIATTALRKGRIDRLQAALADGTSEECDKQRLAIQSLMVPDGHVDTTTASSMVGLLTENGESVTLPCLRSCYVCKVRYRDLHSFYDQLCPACADINWSKRFQTADLRGRVAVVTGARVKIGYQVCLKLLRAGATVIATTRFPNSAVQSYRREADFTTWKDNLQVYGLDLRDVAGLEAFTRFLKQQFATSGVDIIINNACQTIRRPAGYYKPAIAKEQQIWQQADDSHKDRLRGCMEFERLRRRIVLECDYQLQRNESRGLSVTSSSILDTPQSESTTQDATNDDSVLVARTSTDAQRVPAVGVDAPFETTGLSHSAAMSQMVILPEDVGVNDDILPPGVSDINGQQLDLRSSNSWLLTMEQVSTPELMECMFINAIAPFVLNSRLKPLMTTPEGVSRPDRYIINVSAMEGKVSQSAFSF